MNRPAMPGTFRTLAIVLATGVGFCVSAPVMAADDGQGSILTEIGGMIGIVSVPVKGDIDYRERPPLVLPPKMELRQPQQPASARDARWPQDPDVEARRKAEAEARKPLFEFTAKEAGARMSRTEAASGRVAVQPKLTPDTALDTCMSEGRNCTRWNPNQGGNLAQNPDTLVAGQEPERQTLTDPPKGYRLATKAVKATTEAPRREREDTSARSFYKTKPKTDE